MATAATTTVTAAIIMGTEQVQLLCAQSLLPRLVDHTTTMMEQALTMALMSKTHENNGAAATIITAPITTAYQPQRSHHIFIRRLELAYHPLHRALN